MRIDEAARLFVTHVDEERRFSPATVVSYRAELRLLGVFTAARQIVDAEAVTRELLVEYLGNGNSTLAPTTRNRKLTVLRSFFGFLIAKKHLPSNPAHDVAFSRAPRRDEPSLTAGDVGEITTVPRFHWLRPPPCKFDFLDFPEADRLVAAAKDVWMTMIVVALKTGLRQGELLGLKWDDVDLVAGRLMVRRSIWRGHEGTPKSGKSREVPLAQSVVEALKKHRHLRGDRVFCREDGKPLTDGDCKHPLWSTCKRAGLRRIGWHVLRHTFASHLVMRGVPIRAVQELMGHSTVEMTMRYAHLSPDARREAVVLLDEPSPFGKSAERHPGGTKGEKSETGAVSSRF